MVRQEGFYAYKAIMGDKNGEIKNIMIPEAYNKYIVSQFMVRKEGEVLLLCLPQPYQYISLSLRS